MASCPRSFLLPKSDSIEYTEDTLQSLHVIKKYSLLSRPHTSFYRITEPRKDSIFKKFESNVKEDADRIMHTRWKSISQSILGINEKNQLVYHESYFVQRFGNLESLMHTVIECIH